MNKHSNDQFQADDRDQFNTANLMQAAKKYRSFANSLKTSVKSLLTFCEWWIVPNQGKIQLTINCPSSNIRTQIFQNLYDIAITMHNLFGDAKIIILGKQFTFESNSEQIINYHQ